MAAYVSIALSFIVVNIILIIGTLATNIKEDTRYRLLIIQGLIFAQFLTFSFARYVWVNLYVTTWMASGVRDSVRNYRKLFFAPLAFVLIMAQFSIISGYILSNVERHWFVILTFTCFGTMMIMVTLVFISQILDSILAILNLNRGRRPSYSQLFKLLCILTLTSVFAISALLNAAQPPVVKLYSIPVHNLPECFKGLSVLQLSDIHIGPTVGKTQVEFIVDLGNKLKPDVIVFTGDLLDAPLQVKQAVEPLSRLKSKYGVFYIAGWA